MKIAVLGTGMVGARSRHVSSISATTSSWARDVDATLAR